MEQHKKMNRREFLRIFGGGIGIASLGFMGCNTTPQTPEKEAMGELPRRKIGEQSLSLWGWDTLQAPTIKDDETGRRQLDGEEFQTIVKQLMTLGVNTFSTSPTTLRGTAQEALGEALKLYPRSKYVLMTEMPYLKDTSFEATRKAYSALFSSLKVETIDFLTLNARPQRRRNQTLENKQLAYDEFRKRFIDNGFLKFLAKERLEGRIRHIGWDAKDDAVLFEELLSSNFEWDYVRMSVNYLDADMPHSPLSPLTHRERWQQVKEHGLPLVAYNPLSGKRLEKLAPNYTSIFKQASPQLSIRSWAFRYIEGFAPLTILSSTPYEEAFEEEIRSLAPYEPFTGSEEEALRKVIRPLMAHPLIPCVECYRCMPCPYGLDIPQLLTHYNRCINEGNVSVTRKDEQYEEARRAFLVGYNREFPRLRQADHCIACGRCVSHCPMAIDIPKEMRRIHEYVEHLKQDNL